MKSLVDYISESQTNTDIKELFEQIDKRLKYQEWDEVASIIEQIFKNKWGKAIKIDDKPNKKLDMMGNANRVDYGFRKAIGAANNMLLGYNVKGKAWIIAIYNARENGVRGAMYNGDEAVEIGVNTPIYWSNIEKMIENAELKLKLRFGEAYEDPARVVTLGFDMLHYDFDED